MALEFTYSVYFLYLSWFSDFTFAKVTISICICLPVHTCQTFSSDIKFLVLSPTLWPADSSHGWVFFLTWVFNNLIVSKKIWTTQQWPQDWKRSVFIPFPKKGNAKECSNYHTIALISHASTVMLKILQSRLRQYKNRELPDVQVGFQKGRGTRDQIANIFWIIE